MSFFNDDNEKDKFFSPVSFTSATDTTTSWAFESSKSNSSVFDSPSKSADSFNAFSPISSSAANETKSSSNFFSTSDAKDSAFGGSWGSAGYNSHSKDQDIFTLKQQAEDHSRFGHWTPQDSFLKAGNAIKNLEDKDWSNRFAGSSWASEKSKDQGSWAFEKSKDDSSWAFSSSGKSDSDWSMKIPSTNSSNWAFSSTSDSSSSWAFDKPSLERWGSTGSAKDAAGDDFDLFKKK